MLSVSQTSEKLGITPQQVRNLCRNGKLNCQKVGRAWVIDSSSVSKLYDESFCGVAEDNIGYGKRKSTKPLALSFFSGAMGMDIGLEKAGFEVVFASEIDNACRKTILKNKPDINLIGDIRNYFPEEIKSIAGLEPEDEIDLIVGGPPCQAFSTAGKRKTFEDERGNVFLNFIDIIIKLRPRFAVIENVRGLLSASLRPKSKKNKPDGTLTYEELPGGALKHIINQLELGGYSVSFNLYNAANFGTPQKRERIVIICSRDGDKPPFLEPTHSEHGDFGLLKWKIFKDAVKDLPADDHDYVKFPEKRLRFYKYLKPGENWRNLPDELKQEAMGASYFSGGGKTGFFRRLCWDKPSPTLVTHPAMPATDLAHPVELRPLSVQEYKRLQEFPDNWIIEGSILEKYKQIGNAVPVGLGIAIGNLLIKLINEEDINALPGFQFSRYNGTDDKTWRLNFEKLLEAEICSL